MRHVFNGCLISTPPPFGKKPKNPFVHFSFSLEKLKHLRIYKDALTVDEIWKKTYMTMCTDQYSQHQKQSQ